MFKLGEEARIPLNDFRPGRDLDQEVWSRYQRLCDAGYEWELLSADTLPQYLPELKAISEANIKDQNRKERGFSVGYFDEEYLQNFPIAVIKKDGRFLAFSNLLPGADKHELATDLLRYRANAPDGIITFMLIESILWGQQQGYEWFNLGMAPLSGMDEHDFSPGWNKLANFVFTYGENIYGFKTVRAYKNQFNPIWEPKFLVCPGGWALTSVLSNLTNIISGGFSHLVKKK